MSCVYNYKGKEYTSREELKKALQQELKGYQEPTIKGKTPVKTVWDKITLQEEAKTKYGTSEFMSFSVIDGVEYVTINDQALQEITSDTKQFRTNDGRYVDVNLQEVQDNPNHPSRKIPGVKDAVQIRILDKALENIEDELLRGTSESEDSLKTRLYNFLNSLGVAVTSMDAVGDVEAIADIANRLIALSNENDLGQFSEEVAHFAVELFDQQNLIDKMLDKIDQTSEYKSNQARYRVKYSQEGKFGVELERKVRKEVLGKILSQKIQDNFTGNPTNSTEVGIFSLLEELWNNLKDLFRITDSNKKFFTEFGNILDSISQNVLQGDVTEFNAVGSKEVFYSLSDPNKKIRTSLMNSLDKLKENHSIHRNKGERRVILNNIEEDIKLGEFFLAVQAQVQLVKNDVQRAKDLLDESRRNNPDSPFDGISDVDLMSIQVANQTLESNLDMFQKILVDEKVNSNNRVLTPSQIDTLIDEIKKTGQLYQEIKNPLTDLSVKKSDEIFTQTLLETGTTPSDIQEIKNNLGTNTDITSISRWIKPVAFMGNPIVKMIYTLVNRAIANSERIGKGVVNAFEDYLKENKVTSEEVNNTLTDGYEIVHQMKYTYTQEVDALKKKQNEYFDKELEKLNAEGSSPEKLYQLKLEIEKAKKLLKTKVQKTYTPLTTVTDNTQLRERVGDTFGDLVVTADGSIVGELLRREGDNLVLLNEVGEEVSIEKNANLKAIEGFIAIHPKAKAIINNYNSEKFKILKRYLNSSGTYDLSYIFPSDVADLSAIRSSFRRHQQEFTDLGVRKTGDELQIALDIAKYYKSKGNIESEELSPELEAEFNLEHEAAKRKGGVDYQNWLKFNAQFTYTDDVFEGMGDNSNNVDEQVSSVNITSTNFQAILNNLGMKESEFTTYQDLYNRLKDKRSKLVSPYKELGEFNEIKGDLIEANSTLKDSLDRVNNLMNYFRLIKKDEGVNEGVKFEPVGNKAFKNKLNTLKGDALTAFINDHATQEKGKYKLDAKGNIVPKTFYYRTYQLSNQKGEAVEKILKPSFNWIMTKSARVEKNPDFSVELMEKGIPQPSEYMKKKHINLDFFNTFGIDPNTDFYAQGEATKNKELFGLRKLMLESKYRQDKKEGIVGHYYTRPSVATSGAKELVNDFKNPGGAYANLKSLMAKSLFVSAEDDETGISEESLKDTDKKGILTKIDYKNKLFTRYRRILRDKDGNPDPSLLSQDLVYSYLAYIQEGINVEEKSKILPKINSLVEKVRHTGLADTANYETSNLKEALDTFLSSVLYGQTMDAGYVLNIGGHQLSTTKLSRTIKSTMTKANLAFNSAVAVTGLVNASLQVSADRYISNIVGKDNVNFGNSEITKLSPEWFKAVGELNPNSKLSQMLRFFNMDTVNEYNQGLTNSRVYRALNESPGMTHLEVAGKISAARSMLMVSDSYRLVTTGYQVKNSAGEIIGYADTMEEARTLGGTDIIEMKDFKPLRAFKEMKKKTLGEQYDEKAVEEEFKNLRDKSYYNYIVDSGKGIDEDKLAEDGFLDGFEQDRNSRLDALVARMNRNVQNYNAEKEGQLTGTERSAAQYSPLFSHLFFHKGWMTRQLSQRINPLHYDTDASAWVEGSYSTLWNVTMRKKEQEELMKFFGSLLTFGAYKDGLTNLSELDKANIRRVQADLVLVGLSFSLFLLGAAAMNGDDDDDNFMVQYAAFIATRNLNEIMSSQLPFVLSEYKATMDKPFSSIGMAADLVASPFNIAMDLYSGDKVTSGVYKDQPKWVKDIIKTSAIKNLYGVGDPATYKQKNIYLRNQSWFMKNSVEWLLSE